MKYTKYVAIGVASLAALWLLASIAITAATPGSLFNNQVSWAPVPNYGYDLDFTRIETDDLNISIWTLDNPSRDNAILYFHGNSGRINDAITEMRAFGDVYSPAYPGYGESEGAPSSELVYESALASYDYLIEEKGLKPENITIFGHSMGGSPATYVASKRPEAKKLVLANTFSSVQSMCFRSYSILCAFNGGILNTAKYAEDVTIPVRHFAYKGDTAVPFEEGEKLYTYFNSADDKEFTEMDKYTHTYLDFSLIGPELL